MSAVLEGSAPTPAQDDDSPVSAPSVRVAAAAAAVANLAGGVAHRARRPDVAAHPFPIPLQVQERALARSAELAADSQCAAVSHQEAGLARVTARAAVPRPRAAAASAPAAGPNPQSGASPRALAHPALAAAAGVARRPARAHPWRRGVAARPLPRSGSGSAARSQQAPARHRVSSAK